MWRCLIVAVGAALAPTAALPKDRYLDLVERLIEKGNYLVLNKLFNKVESVRRGRDERPRHRGGRPYL